MACDIWLFPKFKNMGDINEIVNVTISEVEYKSMKWSNHCKKVVPPKGEYCLWNVVVYDQT